MYLKSPHLIYSHSFLPPSLYYLVLKELSLISSQISNEILFAQSTSTLYLFFLIHRFATAYQFPNTYPLNATQNQILLSPLIPAHTSINNSFQQDSTTFKQHNPSLEDITALSFIFLEIIQEIMSTVHIYVGSSLNFLYMKVCFTARVIIYIFYI